ncbi:mucin-binding protein [Lactococcus insecticola]|nr:LPXTG cell wall anchor domain-containing protein [Lactococcus insecticola]
MKKKKAKKFLAVLSTLLVVSWELGVSRVHADDTATPVTQQLNIMLLQLNADKNYQYLTGIVPFGSDVWNSIVVPMFTDTPGLQDSGTIGDFITGLPGTSGSRIGSISGTMPGYYIAIIGIQDNGDGVQAAISPDRTQFQAVVNAFGNDASTSSGLILLLAPGTQQQIINIHNIDGTTTTGSQYTVTDAGFDAIDLSGFQISGYTMLVDGVPGNVLAAEMADKTNNGSGADSVPQVHNVTYQPHTQAATVTFLDETTGQVLGTIDTTGNSDSAVLTSDISDQLQTYLTSGYSISENQVADASYDHDDDKNQAFTIGLKHDTTTAEDTVDASYTVDYVVADGDASAPDAVTTTATIAYHYAIDLVTQTVIPADADMSLYNGAAAPTYTSDNADVAVDSETGMISFKIVNSPELSGYTADKSESDQNVTTVSTPNVGTTVTYTKDTETTTTPSEPSNDTVSQEPETTASSSDEQGEQATSDPDPEKPSESVTEPDASEPASEVTTTAQPDESVTNPEQVTEKSESEQEKVPDTTTDQPIDEQASTTTSPELAESLEPAVEQTSAEPEKSMSSEDPNGVVPSSEFSESEKSTAEASSTQAPSSELAESTTEVAPNPETSTTPTSDATATEPEKSTAAESSTQAPSSELAEPATELAPNPETSTTPTSDATATEPEKSTAEAPSTQVPSLELAEPATEVAPNPETSTTLTSAVTATEPEKSTAEAPSTQAPSSELSESTTEVAPNPETSTTLTSAVTATEPEKSTAEESSTQAPSSELSESTTEVAPNPGTSTTPTSDATATEPEKSTAEAPSAQVPSSELAESTTEAAPNPETTKSTSKPESQSVSSSSEKLAETSSASVSKSEDVDFTNGSAFVSQQVASQKDLSSVKLTPTYDINPRATTYSDSKSNTNKLAPDQQSNLPATGEEIENETLFSGVLTLLSLSLGYVIRRKRQA